MGARAVSTGGAGVPPATSDVGDGGREGRKVVAVVAWPGSTEAVRPLVAALARHVEVRALSRAPAPDAVLITHPRARHRAPAGLRDAVVDGDVLRVGTAALPLPGSTSVATAAWPPLAPHVRARWRQRLGLDPDLVIATVAWSPDDVPTGLAVAAAAVVDRLRLPLALALGCPVVTDAAAAEAVGAADGDHVVVGGWIEAEALARDQRTAARLSRRARQLARDRLDPDVTVGRLLAQWGWVPSSPGARLQRALDELGTGPSAPIRRRCRDALVFP